jgi:hypothetical protein
MTVTVCFSASDVYEMERIASQYEMSRAVLVRCVMKRFMALEASDIRKWLLEEELAEKKGRLVAEKKRIEAEIARIEKDIGNGGADAPILEPRKGGGVGEKQDAASRVRAKFEDAKCS